MKNFDNVIDLMLFSLILGVIYIGVNIEPLTAEVVINALNLR